MIETIRKHGGGIMLNQVSGTANMEVKAESVSTTAKKKQIQTEKMAEKEKSVKVGKEEKAESTEKNLSKMQLKQLKQAIEEANRKARLTNTAREYSYDEVTNRVCVKITDKDTEKVIREVPTEESLKRITRMLETAGLVVDEKM